MLVGKRGPIEANSRRSFWASSCRGRGFADLQPQRLQAYCPQGLQLLGMEAGANGDGEGGIRPQLGTNSASFGGKGWLLQPIAALNPQASLHARQPFPQPACFPRQRRPPIGFRHQESSPLALVAIRPWTHGRCCMGVEGRAQAENKQSHRRPEGWRRGAEPTSPSFQGDDRALELSGAVTISRSFRLQRPAMEPATTPHAPHQSVGDEAAGDRANHVVGSAVQSATSSMAAGSTEANSTEACPAEASPTARSPTDAGPAEAAAELAALTSGGFAQGLIEHQIRRLATLQGQVDADDDPEPLHQLRVTLRRLRTALLQFGPALVLPEGVNVRRLAAVARRTSRCRDLDVLRLRFKTQLLPRLPKPERRVLSSALQRLERERSQAFDILVEELHSSRYRKLLQRLNNWQKQPRFTPLGELPLLPWLVEWQAPFQAGLFLHPGWRELDPAATALHGLRKRIKAARYGLDIVDVWCEPPLLAWIDDLRQAQDHLGELHDLQVLNHNLSDSVNLRQRPRLPVLRAELEALQLQHWLRWRALAERLQRDEQRTALQRHLLTLGHGPLAAAEKHPPLR